MINLLRILGIGIKEGGDVMDPTQLKKVTRYWITMQIEPTQSSRERYGIQTAFQESIYCFGY